MTAGEGQEHRPGSCPVGRPDRKVFAGESAPLRPVVQRRRACRCRHAGLRCFAPLLKPSPSVGIWRTVATSGSDQSGELNVAPCGVVKWFGPDRGIGLISQEGAGPDVQAEASAIHGMDRRLPPGEVVLFDVTLDSSGLRADSIHRPVGSDAQPPTPRTRWPCTEESFVPRRRSCFPAILQSERGPKDLPGLVP
ncbi:cold-shock protein [Streptomyces sp. NPDC056485]|uniref:cold-shock protein n=1 Tax=Streptomyces sp. NPDC056485 TaxID=3345834 RepID=UPI0036A465D5